MAKLTAPLLSFSASGTIAGVQTYSKWKGINYVRQRVDPANPNTAEQISTRSVFSFLMASYKVADSIFQEPWKAYAQGKPLTDRNAFAKFNVANLRPDTDLSALVFSPGNLGGLPPTISSVTNGDDQLTVNISAPAAIPEDWTIVAAQAAAIRDQDPHSGILYTINAAEDETSAYAVVITGLTANLYRVGAWLKWMRPDGKIAYSPSVLSTGTPT